MLLNRNICNSTNLTFVILSSNKIANWLSKYRYTSRDPIDTYKTINGLKEMYSITKDFV